MHTTTRRAFGALVPLFASFVLVIGACADAPPEAESGGGGGGSSGTSAGPTTAGSGGAAGASALAACLDAGGSLQETSAIDNNVAVMHGTIASFALARNGQMAIGSSDGALKWWTIEGEVGGSEQVTYENAVGTGPVAQALAYAPSSEWLVAGRDSGVVERWSIAEWAMVDSFALGDSPVTAVAVSGDGSRVAMANASAGGHLTLWTESGAIGPLESTLSGIQALAFRPGSDTLYAAGADDARAAIEVHQGEAVAGAWIGPMGSVRALAVTADGARLVAVGAGFVAVLDGADPSEPVAFAETDHAAVAVALSPDEDFFITAGSEGALRVWDIGSAAERSRTAVPDVVSVAADASSGKLVAPVLDGHVSFHACSAP